MARPLRTLTPAASILLVAGAAAWIAVVVMSRGMGSMPGTMSLGIGAFIGVWTLMMSAMMLPSVTPFASMYTRTFTERRAVRVAAFATGYLVVWAAAGVPAFALAELADRATTGHTKTATLFAVLIFATSGVFQLTGWKQRCLARCRSPLGSVLYYTGFRGRLRDLRVGVHHGAFCLGCCWALMILLVAFGLMNVAAMVALALVVLVEKSFVRGAGIARAFGVVALTLAVLVVFTPALAPGLRPSPPGAMSNPVPGGM